MSNKTSRQRLFKSIESKRLKMCARNACRESQNASGNITGSSFMIFIIQIERKAKSANF